MCEFLPELALRVFGRMVARGLWWLAGVTALCGAVNGLLGAGLVWLVVRLFRGRRAGGGLTALPLWLVQAAGVLLPSGMAYGAYLAATQGLFEEALLFAGVPVALLGVPWLVRRRLRGK